MSLPARELGDTPVPLPLLTGDVPLAALLGMLATAQLWAMVDGELAPAASIPSV